MSDTQTEQATALLPMRVNVKALSAQISTPSGELFRVEESYTGAPLAELPVSDLDQIDTLFEQAKITQKLWATVPVRGRAEIFSRLFRFVDAAEDELVHLVQAETGKTRGQAYEEVFATLSTLRFLVFKGPSVLRPKKRASGIPLIISTRVEATPVGTVGVITPWNYPLSLAAFDVLPALFAGNSVIQKVDQLAPLAVLKLRELAQKAGLPNTSWQIVTGKGSTIGQAIVDRADYLAFTGSTAVGKKLYRDLAARFVSGSFELGGKNACLILPDANLQAAVKQLLYSSFSSLGQLCVSIERVFVPKPLQKRFESELLKQLRTLNIGASYNGDTDYGSLISKQQLDKMVSIIDTAVSEGAHILAGGKARPDLGPYFFEPTVLTGMTDDMTCSKEESFGPIIGISGYDSVSEAISRINASEYGLNAGIFTTNIRAAKSLAEKIHTGSVNINEGYRATFSSAAADMGGMKHSGLGRRNGAVGLLRFTESKTTSQVNYDFPLPTTAKDFHTMMPVMKALQNVLFWLRRP